MVRIPDGNIGSRSRFFCNRSFQNIDSSQGNPFFQDLFLYILKPYYCLAGRLNAYSDVILTLLR